MKGAQTCKMLLCFLCGDAWVARLRRCFTAFSNILVRRACDNAEEGVMEEYV